MTVPGDLSYVGISVVTVLSAGIGAYIGAYLKKRGENLATHDDFKKMLAELQETTRATKEIEKNISQEMWNEQRIWELKKEAIFSMMQALGSVDDKIVEFEAACFATFTPPLKVEAESMDRTRQALYEALDDFSRKRSMALLVCGRELMNHLNQVREVVRNITNELRQNKEMSEDSYQQLRNLYNDAFEFARRELRIPHNEDDLIAFTSQSSESSATPAPGSQAPATDKPDHR